MNQLDICNLSVHYDDTVALTSVEATLSSGQIVGVMGPNGSGKSSLIKCIAGILTPTAGEVLWNGVNTLQHGMSLSYIPQREDIDWDFPITVHDVVEMGVTSDLPFYKKPSAEMKQRIEAALNAVDMWSLRHNHIRALSGGQQQRMFLARALAREADLLLLDEPFNGLDARATDQMIEQLRTLAGNGVTIVLVHHELSNAKAILDSVLLLNGSLIATGHPRDVLSPDTLKSVYGQSFSSDS